MLLSASEIRPGEQLHCDVCIIGGGAAGIVIASQLAESSLDVVVLESGALRGEPRTQALYRGTLQGVPQLPLDESRLRYFGGSTNHWAGMCRPLDAEDFASRPWVARSGWPISRAELAPWYAGAEAICGLPPFDGAPEAAEGPDAEAEAALDPRWAKQGLSVKSFQFATNLKFGRTARPALARAPRVRIVLDANARELVPTADGNALERVVVQTLEGIRFSVSGRQFVLACGGIENPRLLLLSNRRDPSGLGNAHDLVGRFFADHPSPQQPPGALVLLDAVAARLAGTWQRDGITVKPSLALTHAVQRREKLLNHAFYLEKPAPADDVRLFDRLIRDGEVGFDQRRLAAEDAELAELLARLEGGRDAARVSIWSMGVEPAPNPDSRVTLADELDALGQRRSRVDWRLLDDVRHTFARASELFVERIAASGAGRAKILTPWLQANPKAASATGSGTDWWNEMWPASHHVGTTRMADDPADGVVDRNCRVFGITNLYIAGSSVFPTAGCVNPTLTIIALSLRLADHLKTASAASSPPDL